MPRPHSLGLLAYIFAAWKQIAGRYFRRKIFSREDTFAGSYFRGKIFSREQYIYSLKYLLTKIFQIHFSRKFPPANIKCYTVHTEVVGYSLLTDTRACRDTFC